MAHALPLLVWALNELVEVGAIAKLLLARQFNCFRIFLIYIIADVIRSFLLWWFSNASVSSDLYASLWLRSEPLLLAFQGLAVFELYARLYGTYPGIGRFARILILAAAGTALSICLITVSIDLSEQWKHPDLQRMMFAKRLLSSVGATLLALTLLFFPKARSARPIFEIGWLLSGLLGAAAVGYFVIDIAAPRHNNSVEIGTITLAVQSAFLIWWIVKSLPDHIETSARATTDAEWARLLQFTRWLKKKDE